MPRTTPEHVQFSITPAVRVQIDHEDTGHTSQLVLDFMRWCLDEDMVPYRGTSTGPTGYVGWHHPEHAEKIRAWLSEHGAEYDWNAG
jgi:hypothetical protein